MTVNEGSTNRMFPVPLATSRLSASPGSKKLSVGGATPLGSSAYVATPGFLAVSSRWMYRILALLFQLRMWLMVSVASLIISSRRLTSSIRPGIGVIVVQVAQIHRAWLKPHGICECRHRRQHQDQGNP